MSPPYKIFEQLDIGPITRDGSVQWSPDNKYISLATTDHIVIVRINTDMLKVPIPNFIHSKTNIDINKTHGTAFANKIIPLKNFIKALPIEDINKMSCDIRVDSDIFTSNADSKKFRWSPSFSLSNQSLIASLNSLGLLEIIYCHNFGQKKLFNINELWYNQIVKKYVKMYKLPNLPSELRKILINICALLWIESFMWVPMNDKTNGILLVCYHRRGLLTVWNISQRVKLQDSLTRDVPVYVSKELSPSSVKKRKKTNKEKNTPLLEPPSMYEHDCNLVKIITDFCRDPFSRENLLDEEFKEALDERVLNVEYINLDGMHAICISRGNGTLELIKLDLSDRNAMNSILGEHSLIDMIMDNIEADSAQQNEPNTSEKSNTDETNTEGDFQKGSGRRKGGRKRKMSNENEEHVGKKAKTSDSIDKTSNEILDDENEANETINEPRENTFSPSRVSIYEKADLMPIANLQITHTEENVILVFNKMSILHVIVLNKKGETAERFHHRMKTRSITAISKYKKNEYLVGTFENKLLVVRINSLDESNSEKVVLKKSIQLPNDTHVLNGVVSSESNFLTVLSLKINVRFETYFATSRNPCYLVLTSVHSASSLLKRAFPAAPLYQQIDLVKCLSNYNLDIVKHNLLDRVKDSNMKYFFLKLFKPNKIDPNIEEQIDATVATLEKLIYLKYIKKCVKSGIFNEQKDVLVLFREWVLFNFPINSYPKLIAHLPSEPYEESCFLCYSPTKVESLRYALCSTGHRVPRCTLSLVQCLGSYVRCGFCLAYACTVYSEDTRLTCVFCKAKFTL